jgi:predicted CXXCH cytochrome family protein
MHGTKDQEVERARATRIDGKGQRSHQMHSWKEVGTVRRLALLLTGGAVWLFLAAVPVLADGGPHISSVNSGTGGLDADSCAGCHRTHQGDFEYLLVNDGETATCLTCHDGQGATTNVKDGIQYVPNANGSPSGTVLGALRDGGFSHARIGSSDAQRIAYTSSRGTSLWAKVPVLVSGTEVTSAHITGEGLNSLSQPGTVWGSGSNSATAYGGKTGFEMSCTSCHNPHGNGQYRILNDWKTYGPPEAFPTVTVAWTNAYDDLITTKSSHDLQPGDPVKISGLASAGITDGTYVVYTVTNAITFTIVPTYLNASTSTRVDLTSNTTSTGTIQKAGVVVTDATLGTAVDDVYPTRNYTVIQTTANLLFASDVTSGGYSNLAGDYLHKYVPWTQCGTTTTGDCITNVSSGSRVYQRWDAPNGYPDATTGAGAGAFNTQMTAWCSACHTRYYVNGNPNPTGLSDGSSAASSKQFSIATGGTTTITASSHGFVVGDQVTFTQTSGETITFSNPYYVVSVPSTSTFKVSATLNGTAVTFTVASTARGTVIRSSVPQTASGWWFPRVTAATVGTAGAIEDGIYRYQHSTVQYRVCTTCHVAHGSNAVMSGRFSQGQTYPGMELSGGTNSYLLKLDNRGTCQACHDPTGTVTAGNLVPSTLAPSVP